MNHQRNWLTSCNGVTARYLKMANEIWTVLENWKNPRKFRHIRMRIPVSTVTGYGVWTLDWDRKHSFRRHAYMPTRPTQFTIDFCTGLKLLHRQANSRLLLHSYYLFNDAFQLHKCTASNKSDEWIINLEGCGSKCLRPLSLEGLLNTTITWLQGQDLNARNNS
jgi:hypothetical protein